MTASFHGQNTNDSTSSIKYIPRLNEYPWTHPPSSFLRTPSAPTLIVSLCMQPFVLSFIHPLEDLFHPTQTSFGLLYLPNTTFSFEKATRDSRNFLLAMSAFLSTFVIWLPKISLFLYFHIHHRLKANLSFHGPLFS